ncbi:MAG: hypothetical protein RR840_07620 [Clostridium sp.]
MTYIEAGLIILTFLLFFLTFSSFKCINSLRQNPSFIKKLLLSIGGGLNFALLRILGEAFFLKHYDIISMATTKIFSIYFLVFTIILYFALGQLINLHIPDEYNNLLIEDDDNDIDNI